MKIGILPSYSKNKRPFLNTFSFVSNYAYRIYKNGASPYGIIFPNTKFDENLLKDYDGFLIPGGNIIYPYHVLTVHYAIINNKPLLGICMGMQTIGLYSYIIHILKNKKQDINYKNIIKTFDNINEEEYLKKIDNHNKENPFYMTAIHNASHEIFLVSPLLKKIYGNIVLQPSLHDHSLKKIYGNFIVSAYSKDGIIEAIEYIKKPFILGVQFHPELEEKNDKLFKYFIDTCK